jgi:hypothetical protein
MEAAVVEQQEIGKGATGVDTDASSGFWEFPTLLVLVQRLQGIAAESGHRGFWSQYTVLGSVKMGEDLRGEKPKKGHDSAKENAEDQDQVGPRLRFGHT